MSSSATSAAPASLTRYDHFISGLTAGALSTLLLHPFDLIKTRMQAALPAAALSTSSSSSPTVSGSALCTVRALVRQGGVAALWTGITPNLVGNTVAWGSYFFLYAEAKQRLQRWKQRELGAADHLSCAAVTGVAVQALTNPLWVVKTRVFLSHADYASMSLLRALALLWREEGLAGFYRGFVPGLLGVSHGAVQFMTYEAIKQRVSRRKLLHAAAAPSSSSLSSPPLSAVETVAMAIVSKSVASVSTYPYQVIRTRLQSGERVVPPYASTWDCVQRVWRSGGMGAMYRGVLVATVKVIPNACAVFVIYEESSKLLSAAAARRQPPG